MFYIQNVCMLSCLNRVWLYDPMDHSLPGSSVPGILQARILEWVAISHKIIKMRDFFLSYFLFFFLKASNTKPKDPESGSSRNWQIALE